MDQLIKETIEKDFVRFFNNVGRKKDYIGELISIKARNLKDCTLYIKGPIFKMTSGPDPEYGVIKTMFKIFFENEYKIAIGTARGFDTMIILILHKGKGTVERVYAIPAKELEGTRIINIPENGQYKKFRIDEKPYNDLFCYMKSGNYSIFEDPDLKIVISD